jgi:biotin carboxyl carrier protein
MWEVHDVLDNNDTIIERIGIPVVLCVLLISLLVCSMLPYSDTLTTRILLRDIEPPQKLLTRSEGRVKYLVKTGDIVSKGQPVGIVLTSTNYEHLQIAKNQINAIKLQLSKPANYTNIIGMIDSLQLGELQPQYLSVLISLNHLNSYLKVKGFETQKESIRKEINLQLQLGKVIKSQKQVMDLKFESKEKQFQSDSIAFHSTLISVYEFENQKNLFLDERAKNEDYSYSIINNKIIVAQLRYRIHELTTQAENELRRLSAIVHNELSKLEGLIDQWAQEYLLVAPMAGVVSIHEDVNLGDYAKAGTTVITLTPEKLSKVIGISHISVEESGNLRVGQEVTVQLFHYPVDDFGMLQGRVSSISTLPMDNQYTLKIIFPEGLRTSRGISLEPLPEMNGTAEIVTSRKTIFDKLTHRLHALQIEL